MIKLETTKGDIVIEVNETAAPVTSANFLKYVQEGFYDGTIFHRVIPNFMIQGGGFIPEIDGLRFFAILSVVLFHINGLSYPRSCFHFVIASGVTCFTPRWMRAILSGVLTTKNRAKVSRFTPIRMGMA